MNDALRAWRHQPDVAWVGDERRVVAAHTSPPDPDGPRILEGAAAWVWVQLADPRSIANLADDSGQPALVKQAVEALSAADLIEPSRAGDA